MAGTTHVSGLGRHLDPSLPSNRFALFGTVVALGVLGAASLLVDDRSLLGAVFGAIAVFLGWAAGRELDPDRPGSAALAMGLALAFALVDVPSALATGVALMGLRLVAGTVGAALKPVDIVAIAGIGVVAAAVPTLWIVGIAVAMWVWSAPEVGDLRRIAVVAYAAGIAAGIAVAAWRTWAGDGYDYEITETAYVLAAVAAAAMLFAVRPIAVVSVTDAGDAVIDARRVRYARIAAGSFTMWAAVMGGVAGFWSMGPVVAALVAAAAFRVFVHPAAPPD